MKKYFLGIIAVALAIGFSAFTAEKKRPSTKQTTYWFTVTASRTISSGSSFVNSELSYAGTSDPGGCSGAGKFCNVSFDATQVTDHGGGNVTINEPQSASNYDEKN